MDEGLVFGRIGAFSPIWRVETGKRGGVRRTGSCGWRSGVNSRMEIDRRRFSWRLRVARYKVGDHRRMQSADLTHSIPQQFFIAIDRVFIMIAYLRLVFH